jgi:hypothetical protein
MQDVEGKDLGSRNQLIQIDRVRRFVLKTQMEQLKVTTRPVENAITFDRCMFYGDKPLFHNFWTKRMGCEQSVYTDG